MQTVAPSNRAHKTAQPMSTGCGDRTCVGFSPTLLGTDQKVAGLRWRSTPPPDTAESWDRKASEPGCDLAPAGRRIVWKSANRWEDRHRARAWKIFRRSVTACRGCRAPEPPTPVESEARCRARSDGYTVQGPSPARPSRRAAPRGPSLPSLARSSKRPPGRSSWPRAPASGPTSESSPEPRPCASAWLPSSSTASCEIWSG